MMACLPLSMFALPWTCWPPGFLKWVSRSLLLHYCHRFSVVDWMTKKSQSTTITWMAFTLAALCCCLLLPWCKPQIVIKDWMTNKLQSKMTTWMASFGSPWYHWYAVCFWAIVVLPPQIVHRRLNDKRVTVYDYNLNGVYFACSILHLSLLMMFATDCHHRLNDK